MSSSNADPNTSESLTQMGFPVSHTAHLSGHNKVVSALTLDPAGARLITGSHDYSLRFYDFGGMDRTLGSFRELEEPCGTYMINHLRYTLTGDRFLAVSDSPQPRIFDRDGHELAVFKRGYPYIKDMANTKGHIAAVKGIAMHPTESERCVTAGMDHSVRLWDLNTCDTEQLNVIRIKNRRGRKLSASACTYHPEATLIAVGCEDGSLQVFNANGPFSRPKMQIPEAHSNGGCVTSLSFSVDKNTLLTRGMDDTMRVWDIRKFKQPVTTFSDLDTIYENTDCLFSPDGKYMVTGTSAPKGQGTGLLVFYQKRTLEKVGQIGVCSGSVNRILWHSKLNQIFVGAADHHTHIFYDPETTTSHKGVLMALGRAPRRPDPSDFAVEPEIITPHALPMFRPEPNSRRQKVKARKDPKKSKKPDMPISGPGRGGRLGTNMSQIMMSELGMVKKKETESDPREALLKHAKEAEENPQFVSHAYKETQPEPIFDYSNNQDEDEENSSEPAHKKRRTNK
eukprot:gb/GECH01002359.1/.p1 GENE.gb/GECH01002359.1/~~gb/GECH01002359.1/.p1  ORF type:complete len:510 (+),score=102.97 gb/GECH01002359.1/:1-1530(+)